MGEECYRRRNDLKGSAVIALSAAERKSKARTTAAAAGRARAAPPYIFQLPALQYTSAITPLRAVARQPTTMHICQ